MYAYVCICQEVENSGSSRLALLLYTKAIGLYMKDSNKVANNFLRRQMLLDTKVDCTKESNTLEDNATIKQP